MPEPRYLADLLPLVLYVKGAREPISVNRPRHLRRVLASYGRAISHTYASMLLHRKAPLSKEMIRLLIEASRGKLTADVLLRLDPQRWPANHMRRRP